MKVAYNACFGGFGLSPLAENEYRKKKGIDLFWYHGVGGYPYQSYEKIKDLSGIKEIGFALKVSTKDLGDLVSEIPNEHFFYESWYDRENRNDPDLIEIIERLGEKANGFFAKLAIKEIPDGVDFEITEYDGFEDVVPPRTTW